MEEFAPDVAMAGASSISPENQQSAEQKKRNRIRFSCTTCRGKKLKCNRSLPCDQCEKRGITATCQYVPYPHSRDDRPLSSPSRARPARPRQYVSDSTLQARLRHLEHLVSVLKSQRKDPDVPPVGGPGDDTIEPADDPSLPPEEDSSYFKLKETAGPIVGDSRYVDAANWEAILEDITKLTDDLTTFDGVGDGQIPAVELEFPKREGPVLLLGSFARFSIPEMLTFLPPRLATDRLIARFFQGKEPAWMMFHVPTFLRQYEDFWKVPEDCSFTWLGLLFMMISHTALFCLRGDEDIPGNLGKPLEVHDIYRNRAAQCLALDDYTKPGKYKVETMILYFGAEYLRNTDAHLGTSVLISIIVRLAMHMGYHRDPKHFKDMSAFEGEMRRRVWTLLTEIDELVSFQFGLPANIQARYFDTEPPRNLLDEDFDEWTDELPTSRPETERTPTLYCRVKSRVMTVFGEILATMNSSNAPPYEKVMALDKKLEAAHDSFASILRMRSFSQSITDPIDLIMQRYWLELLYQKARSVLHRKFLGAARLNNRYAYSRWTCIDAAAKTLQHQYDIHMEIQPGGRLSKERWFVSSLSIHDFLLADMILCLELSYVLHMSQQQSPSMKTVEPEKRLAIMPKDQLLEILRTSRSIWQASRKESAEANRAFKILTRMLATSTGADYESSPESSNSVLEAMDLRQPPSFQFPLSSSSYQPQQFTPAGVSSSSQMDSAASAGNNTTPAWSSSVGFGAAPSSIGDSSAWTSTLPYGSGAEFEGIGIDDQLMGLIDADPTTDWSVWDNQIHNSSAERMQIPWSNFFPPEN